MGTLTRYESWQAQDGILKRLNRDTVPDRNILVWGVDKPTPDITGTLPEITRSTINGNQTYSGTSTQEFNNIEFSGKVSITGSGTKIFRNCVFRSNGGSGGLLHCVNALVADVQVYDSLFKPDTPSGTVNGVQGHHFQIYRSRFMDCIDAVRIHNVATDMGDAPTGVILQQNLFDKHMWVGDASSGFADGSHTDGVQIEGGSGTIIRGNYFNGYHNKAIVTPAGPPFSRQGYLGAFSGNAPDDTLARSTSCIMCTPNVGAVTGIEVRKNWFSGGEIMCNFGNDDNAGNNIGTFTDNRFERNSYFTGHTLDFQNGASFTASGNVYDDDGTAVTIRTNA
jgi:hypothetical protein